MSTLIGLLLLATILYAFQGALDLVRTRISGRIGRHLEELAEVLEGLDVVAGELLGAREVVEDGPERRIGYMADPDGFQWEIAWTPKWHELTD